MKFFLSILQVYKSSKRIFYTVVDTEHTLSDFWIVVSTDNYTAVRPKADQFFWT